MESFGDYKKRLISYVGGEDPFSILKRTPVRLQKLFKKNAAAKWRRRAGSDQWSAAQILAHLAEGEMVLGFRIRLIASANGTPIQAFDQNAWVQNSDYLVRKPAESFALFQLLRKNNLAFLKQLKPEAWTHYGVHSERGKETLTQVAALYAGHDLNHMRQLEERLQ